MIIEDAAIFNNEEKDIVNNIILGETFPFYWHPYQVVGDDCPYFRHNLIDRNDKKVTSPFINFFDVVIKRFLKKHNIEFKQYLRACINLTYPINKEKGEAHVDHYFNYSSILIYLNSSSGCTVIYDYKYDENLSENQNLLNFKKNEKVLKKIKPEQFKIVYIKNPLYHCLEYPLINRRLIGVFTFN